MLPQQRLQCVPIMPTAAALHKTRLVWFACLHNREVYPTAQQRLADPKRQCCHLPFEYLPPMFLLASDEEFLLCNRNENPGAQQRLADAKMAVVHRAKMQRMLAAYAQKRGGGGKRGRNTRGSLPQGLVATLPSLVRWF